MAIIFNRALIAPGEDLSTVEEAIRYAGTLLAAQGICSPEYIDEMCQVYQAFGPAIVLDYGLAMPHARPEKGARHTGFAIVTTRQPLYFGHEEFDPVSVVIAIAGVDATSHINMIQLIARLIEVDIVAFLQQEKDRDAILHFIQRRIEESLC